MPAPAAMSCHARPLEWTFRPPDLLAAWPHDRPLACLISAGTTRRDRWSIFAEPVETIAECSAATDPLSVLEDALARSERAPADHDPEAPPFVGGLVGWISYDLGRFLEPRAQSPAKKHRAHADRAQPLFELHHCPGAFLHDALTGQWMAVGDPAALPAPAALSASSPRRGCRVEPFTSRTGREQYEAAVARAIEYIRAGDIFQANLAHRLSARFLGPRRDAARALLIGAGARYGAYVESPRFHEQHARAICSLSPELFLSFDPITRRVETRPIKGTRAHSPTALIELAESPKDAAELAMIVDLMRNDLGRVCEYGSIRVDDPRSIETHANPGGNPPRRTQRRTEGGIGMGSKMDLSEFQPQRPSVSSVVQNALVHGVATVSGRLRPGLGVFDLLRAAFPPGSVTGAPKIRAMQIIDELEPARRGAYCGCIGFVSDSGHASWNVAIRTAEITGDERGGRVEYAVGAGIVADSDPATEWEETIHKAGVLERAFPGSLKAT